MKEDRSRCHLGFPEIGWNSSRSDHSGSAQDRGFDEFDDEAAQVMHLAENYGVGVDVASAALDPARGDAHLAAERLLRLSSSELGSNSPRSDHSGCVQEPDIDDSDDQAAQVMNLMETCGASFDVASAALDSARGDVHLAAERLLRLSPSIEVRTTDDSVAKCGMANVGTMEACACSSADCEGAAMLIASACRGDVARSANEREQRFSPGDAKIEGRRSLETLASSSVCGPLVLSGLALPTLLALLGASQHCRTWISKLGTGVVTQAVDLRDQVFRVGVDARIARCIHASCRTCVTIMSPCDMEGLKERLFGDKLTGAFSVPNLPGHAVGATVPSGWILNVRDLPDDVRMFLRDGHGNPSLPCQITFLPAESVRLLRGHCCFPTLRSSGIGDHNSADLSSAWRSLQGRALLESPLASLSDVASEAALLQVMRGLQDKLELRAHAGTLVYALADLFVDQKVSVCYTSSQESSDELGDLLVEKETSLAQSAPFVVTWVSLDGESHHAGVRVGHVLCCAHAAGVPVTEEELSVLIPNGKSWRPAPGYKLTFAGRRRSIARSLLTAFTDADNTTSLASLVSEIFSQKVSDLVMEKYGAIASCISEIKLLLASFEDEWTELRSLVRQQATAENQYASLKQHLKMIMPRLDAWRDLWHTRLPRRTTNNDAGSNAAEAESGNCSFAVDVKKYGIRGLQQFGMIPGLLAVEVAFQPAVEAFCDGGLLRRHCCHASPLEAIVQAEKSLWTALGAHEGYQRLWILEKPSVGDRISGVLAAAITSVFGMSAPDAPDFMFEMSAPDSKQWDVSFQGPLLSAFKGYMQALQRAREAWAEVKPYSSIVYDVLRGIPQAISVMSVRHQAAQITSLADRQSAIAAIWHTMDVLRDIATVSKQLSNTVSCAQDALARVQRDQGFLPRLGRRLHPDFLGATARCQKSMSTVGR